MADEKQTSALMRRQQQLKRWEDSDTNRESITIKEKPKRVNFQDGCIFLAACSCADKGEVLKLLDRGADINTANVDGLTALHQACIDDNLEMVEFLVENKADVDVCDNEGWTPLHATASCGFTHIAKYLIDSGANVAAVNNDGDLPIDICENDGMEQLLQDEMDLQEVDAEAARHTEENCMLADANQWLNSKDVKEVPHGKTGATALHVASAKGYIEVIKVLLQVGVNINARDFDGWTPLHAAAHWGQEEASRILAENFCDIEIKNNAGQTAFDVADADLYPLLEEMKKRQATLKEKDRAFNREIIQSKGLQVRRRTSVTRMSGDQKQNVVIRMQEQERATFEANYFKPLKDKDEEKKSISSSGSEEESSGSEETERQQNEINNAEIQMEDNSNADVDSPLVSVKSSENTDEGFLAPAPEKVENSLVNEISATTAEKQKTEEHSGQNWKDVRARTVSAPAQLPEVPQVPSFTSQANTVDSPKHQHQGLRKIGSSSMFPITTIHESDNIPRSASSPRLAFENRFNNMEKLTVKRPYTSISTPTTTDNKNLQGLDRYNYLNRNNQSPYRKYSSFSSSSSYQSAYVPYYRRQQEQNELREKERVEKQKGEQNKPEAIPPATTIVMTTTTVPSLPSQPSTVSGTAAITTTATVTTSPLTVSPVSTISTPSIPVHRRSYEPPKRDEETETQRKARAKRARETRRSTQGITIDDIVKAEEVLKQTREAEEKENKEKDKKDRDLLKIREDNTKTRLPTDNNIIDTTVPAKTSTEEVTLRRRSGLERTEEGTHRSYTRARDRQELSSSNTPNIYSYEPTSSYYMPRSQRNVLSMSDISNTTSKGLTRTPSIRNQLHNEETDRRKEEEKRKEEESSKDNKDKESLDRDRRESSALRARRARRERRSTGLIDYSQRSEDYTQSGSKEVNKTDDDNRSLSSRVSNRCGSASDVAPSVTDWHYRQDRPSSYAGLTKSSSSLDTDYKRLYEEEKIENARLKKELDQSKRDLSSSKNEVEKLRRQQENASSEHTADKRERRTLERKLSELESQIMQMDKLKADYEKLKEENRALTRVISRLSR